jgi:V-type H+-transporting ATPase subunit a
MIEGEATTGDYIYKRESTSCVYPMGMDPTWGMASNRISMVNGVKMKMSVIFGILHMSMGIIVKGTNTIYFKRYLEFFTEVCTGLIILLGLFGWMDALIFAKWFKFLDINDTTPSVGRREIGAGIEEQTNGVDTVAIS